MHVDRRRGFSFLEILIVGVIVLLLVTIALPCFIRARTFVGITQTNSDLQMLATALMDYQTALLSEGGAAVFPPSGGISQDRQVWSPWRDDVDYGSPNFSNNNLHACSIIWIPGSFYDDAGDSSPTHAAPTPSNTEHYDLRVMTSPIEAITQVPIDPFKNSGSLNSQYDYFGLNLENSFVLRGLGPDGVAAVGCSVGGFNCACTRGFNCAVGHGLEGYRSYFRSKFRPWIGTRPLQRIRYPRRCP